MTVKTLPAYVNEESFNAYVKYLAMKKHFTSDNYDYMKYNGKVRASFDSFRTRNDTYYFAKLIKMDDWENVLLANMIMNSNTWIRDIVEEDGEKNYLEWKKKIDSLGYIFGSDLKKLNEDYKSNFISNGQHPEIMTLYLQKKISLETFSILTHMANIFDYWSEKIVDKIVARDIIRLSRKYYPFLNVDVKRFKTIVKDHFLL